MSQVRTHILQRPCPNQCIRSKSVITDTYGQKEKYLAKYLTNITDIENEMLENGLTMPISESYLSALGSYITGYNIIKYDKQTINKDLRLNIYLFEI